MKRPLNASVSDRALKLTRLKSVNASGNAANKLPFPFGWTLLVSL